jgi:hypothetical protein
MTTAPDHALGRRSARPSGVRGAASGAVGALMSADSRVGVREMGLATVVLFLAGFVLYGSHIAHGSFYYDDWSNAALVAYPPHPGFAGALSEYWSLFGFRPFVALYVPAVHEIFGLHEHWFIAWSVALLAAMSATLYLALRTVGLRRVHAIAISALALVTPFPDATTLWSTASTAHLVIILYLLGLVLAIHAMNAPTRRQELTLHLVSLVLIAIAVTTYELVATVALCSVLIYVWRTSVRKALIRFFADVIVIGLALAWTGSQTGIDEVQSAGGAVTHARLLFSGGLQIVAGSIEPLGSPPEALVLAVAGALLLIGVGAWRLSPRDDPSRRELGRWLVVAVAGVLFAYAAWAVFVPSDPYYEATGLGVGNRTNALAVVGLAALTFALAMIVGTLLFRRSRRGPALATSLALAATLAIGLSYAHRTRVDIYNWDQASHVQSQVFSALHRAIPRPAAGSTIYAYGFTNWPALGVPAFAASWDLNGAVKLTYRDASLRGYPVFSPTEVVCARHGVYPVGNGYTRSGFTSRYGHAYLLDVAGVTGARPLNQAHCDQVLRHPAPAPSS